MRRQSQLLEAFLAAGASSGIAHFLHGGQQQPDQDGDDRDHHQQFDEREAHLLTNDTNHDLLLKKLSKKNRKQLCKSKGERQTSGLAYPLSRLQRQFRKL